MQPFQIVPRSHAHIDGHAERRAGLDGIHTDIIAFVIEPGDRVEIRKAEVGAQQSDVLILKRGTDLLPGGIGVDVAAFDQTPVHAGDARLPLSSPAHDRLIHRFAAETIDAVDGTLSEVTGRQCAHGIDGLDDGGRSGFLIDILDFGIVDKFGMDRADHIHELLPVMIDRLLEGPVHDHRLDPFAAHDGPQTAPGGKFQLTVRIGRSDRRHFQAVFSGRPDAEDTDILAELGPEFLIRFIGSQLLEFIHHQQGRPFFANF